MIFAVTMILLIFEVVPQSLAVEPKCSKSIVQVPEMILGATPLFPWMGILQVRLHEVSNIRLAVTGVLLIKNHFGLAVASDIERIPHRLIREQSRVMFIADQGIPWYCKIKDYITHPEYDMKNFTTIAILDLETFDDEPFKPKAICWPDKYYLYTRAVQLYAFEFTDDRMKLEKRIRKLQYANPEECDKFYSKFEMKHLGSPASFECAYATHSKSFCVWENGVVMASNNTGYWIVVGLGVQGPGCAAPGRFISLSLYLPWIKLFTSSSDEGTDEPRLHYTRKSAFGTGFRNVISSRVETPYEVIPIHNLPSNTKPSRNWFYEARFRGIGKHPLKNEWRSVPWSFYDKYLDKEVTIKQESPTQVKLNLFTSQTDADIYHDPCRTREDLLYNEDIAFSIYEDFHAIEYWISIYNTYVSNNYTCIIVTVLAEDNKFANLSVTDWIVLSPDETPSVPMKMLNKYKNKTIDFQKIKEDRVKKFIDRKTYRQPLNDIELDFLDAPHKITTLNFKVSFMFLKQVILRVEVYGRNHTKSTDPKKPPKKIVFPGARGTDGGVVFEAIPDPLPQDSTDILRLFHKPKIESPFFHKEGEKIWMENENMKESFGNVVHCSFTTFITLMIISCCHIVLG